MSEIVLNLIVLAITLVIIIFIFGFIAYRKRQRQSQMVQAALERGWNLDVIKEGLVSGFRISGKFAEGAWTLESRADASARESGPGSSEVGHSTRWWSADARLPDRAVVLGPRPGSGMPSGLENLNTPLIQMGLRLMLGEDAEWISLLSAVALQNPAVAERYLCLASDPQDVERLLSPQAERLLLNLPARMRPVIKLRSTGIEISLPTLELKDIGELEQMIELGKTLLMAWLSTHEHR